MAKPKTHYVCRSCGGVQTQWMGKCPECGVWDSLERFTEQPASTSASPHASLAQSWTGSLAGIEAAAPPSTASTLAEPKGHAAPIALPLPDIETSDVPRIPTGLAEFDRVLGGGIVPGSVVLLGGDPGIGKSTLLLQAAAQLALANPDHPILYVSSEESAYQTRLRAQRLFEDSAASTLKPEIRKNTSPRKQAKSTVDPIDPAATSLDSLQSLYVLADTNLARIVEQARRVQPAVLIIDSVQMIYKSDLPASPGSVTQLRRCATELVYLAKVSNMAIILVGHVTKDGQLAGPKLLEHLVDAVLSFEGDRHHAHRVVRAVKNRFGPTLEVGLFEMTGSGLVEVTSASALLDPASQPRPGSAICPAILGTRCILVEIQALTATGFLGSAKRKAAGLDPNRLAMLIAVLEKHGGLRLADQDVFTSVVGGLKVTEPAADLALALAIAGAHYNRSLPGAAAVIGEIGLGGEIRAPRQLDLRLREAARLGFSTIIAPPLPDVRLSGQTLLPIRTISDAVNLLV